MSTIDEIPIYCTRHMPELPNSIWIECSSCKEWYHSDICVKVPPNVGLQRPCSIATNVQSSSRLVYYESFIYSKFAVALHDQLFSQLVYEA